MITPPPPDEDDADEMRQAPKPKKTWVKPIIRPIVDGVVVTESGFKAIGVEKDVQYRVS